MADGLLVGAGIGGGVWRGGGDHVLGAVLQRHRRGRHLPGAVRIVRGAARDVGGGGGDPALQDAGAHRRRGGDRGDALDDGDHRDAVDRSARVIRHAAEEGLHDVRAGGGGGELCLPGGVDRGEPVEGGRIGRGGEGPAVGGGFKGGGQNNRGQGGKNFLKKKLTNVFFKVFFMQ